MADITMPQLGETVTEGTITKWFKQVGDQVDEDEVLFEVSTDKVDSEVPSPAAGYLDRDPRAGGRDGRRRRQAGRDRRRAAAGRRRRRRPRPSAAAEPAEPPSRGRAEAGSRGRAGEPAPAERRAPSRAARGRAAEPDAAEPEAEPAAGAEPRRPRRQSRRRDGAGDGDGDRVLSPVVRRLIAEHDLDPDQIEGTGAGGRITRADVLAVIDTGRPRPAAPARRRTGAAAGSRAGEPRTGSGTAPQRQPRRRPRRRPRPGERRRGRAVHQHPQAHGRAHGAVAGHVGPHARRSSRSTTRASTGCAGRPRTSSRPRRASASPTCPFIARAVDRRHPRVPARQRVGRRRRADRPPRRPPRHRRRPRLRGPASCPSSTTPTASACGPSPARSPTWPAGPATKKLGADDISGGTFTITNPGPLRHAAHRARSSTSPRWPSCRTDGVKKRPVVVELPDGTDAIAVHPVGNLALSLRPPGLRRRLRRRRSWPSCKEILETAGLVRRSSSDAAGSAGSAGSATATRTPCSGRCSSAAADDYLLLLEHPHVYTLGVRADARATCSCRPRRVGAELVATDRGGDVTYHGPGQLVGYPIVGVPDRARRHARATCTPSSSS